MQQRTTNGVGKRLDEVKLVVPINVTHKCGHLVDIDGMLYCIRLDCDCEISLKLHIDRKLVTRNSLFFIDTVKSMDAEIVQA